MKRCHDSHYLTWKTCLFSPGPVRPDSPVVNCSKICFWLSFGSFQIIWICWNKFFVRDSLVHGALTRPDLFILSIWIWILFLGLIQRLICENESFWISWSCEKMIKWINLLFIPIIIIDKNLRNDDVNKLTFHTLIWRHH